MRENNAVLGKTTTCSYDDGGNITYMREYAFTYSANLSDDYEEEEDTDTDTGVTKPGGDSYVPEIWSTSSTVYPTSVQQYKYTNSWGDQLTSYNGSSISYDSYGNPTTYLGGTMSWTRGRLLSQYKPSGHTYAKNMGYNVDGVRISKSYVLSDNAGRTVSYAVDGTRILREVRTDSAITGSSSTTLVYMYTHNGLVGLTYNGAQYRYVKNIQGDIIAILDSSNDVVAKYIYDAWGNHAVCDASGSNISSGTHIANINPFRYRGYYYDTELDLYYLNSRYYDPNTGRFINADTIDYLYPESINGLNLYAYCLNNPIMYVDPSGHFPILAAILGIIAVTGLGLTIGGVATENNVLTAIGLTLVTVPALISGGIAIGGAIATGATLSGIVGGVTVSAGIGTSLFASAEYEQAITGNNWMLDAGMSEGWYNGLMLTTASIATLGTFASSFTHAFNIKSITGIGKYGKYGQQGYSGIKFTTGAGKTRVLTFQMHGHFGNGILEWHWQLSKWNPLANELAGTIGRWIWWNLL